MEEFELFKKKSQILFSILIEKFVVNLLRIEATGLKKKVNSRIEFQIIYVHS